MKKKKRRLQTGTPSFGPRAFSGYVDYRYGPKNVKAKNPEKILSRGRREAVVSQILAGLKGWRSSPFEFEATSFYGLLHAFCREGHGFARSAFEAETIVAECLNMMGAVRPSFAEGQPRYLIACEDCQWCGGELPREATTGNRNLRFCSDGCASSAYLQRDAEKTKADRQVYDAAYRAVSRQAMPARQCAQCSKPFRPLPTYPDQRFCSHDCLGDSKRIMPVSDCFTCGKPTRWDVSTRQKKYCSIQCFGARPDKLRFKRTCLVCGCAFDAATATTDYCSEVHNRQAWKIKKGVSTRLVPAAFDYIVRRQGIGITDALFAEAA